MAVGFPRPTNHVLNEPGFPAILNDIEGSLNRLYEGTGWRSVTGILVNGWTASTLKIRRVGTRVDGIAIGLDGTAATASNIVSLGASWGLDESTGASMPIPTFINDNPVTTAPVRINRDGVLSSAARVANMRVNFSWGTNLTWPASLPGVAI